MMIRIFIRCTQKFSQDLGLHFGVKYGHQEDSGELRSKTRAQTPTEKREDDLQDLVNKLKEKHLDMNVKLRL